MILLVLVSIYIFKQFGKLAESKGYKKSTWGGIGVAVYLVPGLGLQLLLGICAVLFNWDIDIESTMVNLVAAVVCYAIGGGAAWGVYLYLKTKESKLNSKDREIDAFGKRFEDGNFE